MPKFRAIVALFLLSLGALASEPVLQWRGLELREIDSVSALPAPIRHQLRVDVPGLHGVADKGKPFNVTDAVDSSKPIRRLLAAGQSGDTWLVALEQGGRGYNVQVYLFSGSVQQQHWVLLGRPATLQAVIQQLPATGLADEG